jgi:phosphate transport system substrate-binding protein
MVTVAVLVAAAGCQRESSTPSPKVTLIGEGATFPAPLYERWIDQYHAVRIEYRATGSSAGMEAIAAHAVDFEGTDAPMTDAQLSESGDVLHIPTTMAPDRDRLQLPLPDGGPRG